MTTKTRIVSIGNARGIRVPKLLLEQAALPDEIELRAEPGRIVVSAASRPRFDQIVSWWAGRGARRRRDCASRIMAVSPLLYPAAGLVWGGLLHQAATQGYLAFAGRGVESGRRS
jgi:antitoxin component of MazEF toxin-antitoxin module